MNAGGGSPSFATCVVDGCRRSLPPGDASSSLPLTCSSLPNWRRAGPPGDVLEPEAVRRGEGTEGAVQARRPRSEKAGEGGHRTLEKRTGGESSRRGTLLNFSIS